MNKYLEDMARQARSKVQRKRFIATSATEAVKHTELLSDLAAKVESAGKSSDEALNIARSANRIAITAIIVSVIIGILSVIVAISVAIGGNH